MYCLHFHNQFIRKNGIFVKLLRWMSIAWLFGNKTTWYHRNRARNQPIYVVLLSWCWRDAIVAVSIGVKNDLSTGGMRNEHARCRETHSTILPPDSSTLTWIRANVMKFFRLSEYSVSNTAMASRVDRTWLCFQRIPHNSSNNHRSRHHHIEWLNARQKCREEILL